MFELGACLTLSPLPYGVDTVLATHMALDSNKKEAKVNPHLTIGPL
jgi:hypothetical protein